MDKPTYFLVHGEFLGAWCWREVTKELDSRDIAWATIDLPSSTFGAPAETFLIDDARAVAALANEIGSVILVGHSYGGAVITEAAEMISDCRGLIYIAGLVPDVNESTTESMQAIGKRTKRDEALRAGDGLFSLDASLAAAALCQDCPEGEQRYILDHLSTQTIASLESPRENGDTEAWRRYITCEFDESVSLSAQAHFAQRCDEAISIPSGHSPFFSMPHTLVDELLS
jgi:pimeloyl-ACP methyl ester carboxylesterase